MSLREKLAEAIGMKMAGAPEHGKYYGKEADAALAAFRQWLADEGLVCVPREATEEMLDAVMSTNTASNVWQAVRIYTAMIAASPDYFKGD